MTEKQKEEEKALQDGKYVNGRQGRRQFGGWTEEGLDVWKETKEEIAKRYKENAEEIEAMQKIVLAEIQKCYVKEDGPAKKRRKKAQKVEEEDDFADFSEIESDEE